MRIIFKFIQYQHQSIQLQTQIQLIKTMGFLQTPHHLQKRLGGDFPNEPRDCIAKQPLSPQKKNKKVKFSPLSSRHVYPDKKTSRSSSWHNRADYDIFRSTVKVAVRAVRQGYAVETINGIDHWYRNKFSTEFPREERTTRMHWDTRQGRLLWCRGFRRSIRLVKDETSMRCWSGRSELVASVHKYKKRWRRRGDQFQERLTSWYLLAPEKWAFLVLKWLAFKQLLSTPIHERIMGGC